MNPERVAFIKKLKLRNYSPCTIRNYELALLKLARYYNASPLKLNALDIEHFLLHELETEKLSPATVNLHAGAFRNFLQQWLRKVKAAQRLPVVLTIVKACIVQTDFSCIKKARQADLPFSCPLCNNGTLTQLKRIAPVKRVFAQAVND